MKFLAPSLLYFLPLAFLPLVIYFLVFRRALRVSFPGLYILRRVYEKNIRGRRFRRAAVLALRCAAAGLLVLAFSRPVLERAPGAWRSGAVRDTPLSVVLLIDTSYSMRTELAGRTVFDMAKNAGLAVLSGMTPEDKAAFGVFSDGWEGAPLAWTAPSEAAARMASLKPGWRTTAYRTALENAYAFLASQDKGRKAIIVLTDGFSQGFKSLAPGGIESVKGYNSAIAVYGLSFPSETGNVWAESVSFNGAELLDGGLK
ncbi:MAG: VWA domain-containing protein, partial [Elusimicrobiaceae bacterium]